MSARERWMLFKPYCLWHSVIAWQRPKQLFKTKQKTQIHQPLPSSIPLGQWLPLLSPQQNIEAGKLRRHWTQDRGTIQKTGQYMMNTETTPSAAFFLHVIPQKTGNSKLTLHTSDLKKPLRRIHLALEGKSKGIDIGFAKWPSPNHLIAKLF